MLRYKSRLQNIPTSSDFTQMLMANTTLLSFRFMWKTEIQEIVDEYEKALEARANADPLWDGKDIIKEYKWIDFYQNIPHASVSDISTWYASNSKVPDSLKSLYEQNRSLFYNQIMERCLEADSLAAILEPFYNQLVWNVEVSDTNGNSVSGTVRPGGWLNNQDFRWRVQFLSDKVLGRNDLDELAIRVEVADA